MTHDEGSRACTKSGGSSVKIEGIGKITIPMSEENGGKDITLSEVLYVPELEDNLISEGQLEEKGLKILAFGGKSEVFQGENLLFQAHRVSRLYYFTTVGGISVQEIGQEHSSQERKVNHVTFSTWHTRLGHPGEQAMRKSWIFLRGHTS